MKKQILALSLIIAILLAFVTIDSIDSITNSTNTVRASSVSFQKNVRGHWKFKPTYIDGKSILTNG